jgi:rubredoxin
MVRAYIGSDNEGRRGVNSNLTLIIILVSVIHVAVLAVMIWIRVRPTEGDGIMVASPKVSPCAVCGEAATDWAYDGLDPDERHDPHSGKAWSADMTHYRPVCTAHGAADVQTAVGDG